MNTGLAVIEVISKLEGISIDIRAVIRDYAISEDELKLEQFLRIIKDKGFKFKKKKLSPEEFLERYPLPAVFLTKKGKYGILLKFDKEKNQAIVLLPEKGKNLLNISVEDLKDFVDLFIPVKHRESKSKVVFGLRWFWEEIKRYKSLMTEILTASLVVQIFGLATPLFTQVILDKVLVHRSITTLEVIAIAFLGVILFEFVLNLARKYVFLHTTTKLDAKLGARIFKHLLSLPITYFESRKVGDTIARIREVDTIRNFLTNRAITVIVDFVFSIVFLIIMLIYSVKLSLVVMGIIFIIAVLFFIITPEYKRRLDERFYTGAKANSYLVESVTGIQTVKSLAIEGNIQKKWENVLADSVKASFNLSNLSNIAGSISELLRRFITIAILFLGVKEVIQGNMTVGQLIAFQMFAGQLVNPVINLVSVWHELQQALLSVDRIGDILNHPTEIKTENSITLNKLVGSIRFVNVRFRYRADTPYVLKNVSFDIKPGMCVGIIGRSGSGKSTIAKLIQRLYIPTEGEIYIDSVDIKHLNPVWLRKNIGVVLQENYLFSGTIRENIAMPIPDAPMELIINVAKIAGAHEFISKLPEGYDTIVGERGSTLSGGQKQRIAIARALITDPRILIFDEATSALDYESEKIVRQNMKFIKEGRTVIVIAHRLTTVKDCDLIIAIDNGVIVEAGSFKQLMRKKGYFYKLYSQQVE
ncbi:peptidase domain-containing ABC transporter [Persephonella sp.]